MSPKVETYLKVYKDYMEAPTDEEAEKLLGQGMIMFIAMSIDEQIEAVEELLKMSAGDPLAIQDCEASLELLRKKRDGESSLPN